MDWDKLQAAADGKTDPHEQLKAVARQTFPGMQFILSCAYCGKPWPDDEIVKHMEEHVAQEHPDRQTKLNMIWIGPGPEPKNRPPRRSRRGIR